MAQKGLQIRQSVMIPLSLLMLFVSAVGVPSAAAQEGGPVVSGISLLSDDRMMISFNMPGPVQGEYYALVGVYEDKRFECFVVDEYPQRLYCDGPRLPSDMLARVRLVNSGGTQTMLDVVVTVPTEPKGPDKEPKCRILTLSKGLFRPCYGCCRYD